MDNNITTYNYCQYTSDSVSNVRGAVQKFPSSREMSFVTRKSGPDSTKFSFFSTEKRFVKKPDDTIYDNYLKKRWCRRTDKIFTLEDLEKIDKYCDIPGNWRLPDREELQSLITKDRYLGRKIYTCFFPRNSSSDMYWSSSEHPRGGIGGALSNLISKIPSPFRTQSKRYWYVDFSTGELGSTMSEAEAYVVLAISGDQ